MNRFIDGKGFNIFRLFYSLNTSIQAINKTHVKSVDESYFRYPFGIDTTLGQGNEPALYHPEEIEPNQMRNDLHRNIVDLYSTEQHQRISTATTYCRDQIVAVHYQSYWYHAHVLEFKPTTNFAWVQFVDQDEICELGTNTMRPLHRRFLNLLLQAYLCCLDSFYVNYLWSAQDKNVFKKKIRNKILYAKKTHEANLIQLAKFVDCKLVLFDLFSKILHHSYKSSQRTKPIQLASLNHNNLPSTVTNLYYSQQSNIVPLKAVLIMSNNQLFVRNLQSILLGIVNNGSNSEYNQISLMIPKSSTMKKSSDVTILPPTSATAIYRQLNGIYISWF
ncbi:unnamed protein product [Rotaria sordida]|uniref:Uncharacterized protein n=1 Tax=Rotaria sordida TaxID=392033 RepID=A0A815J7X1_9BILA|nr:unnamed protein product [Rotaria sordida]CAF1295057.1 unnamed protein product [Rotaria sordida]CAF1378421.1 unnamed protein product [Rotaria sordida]CAF3773563.1 unnamed protein product [Rotaria sordida]CAF3797500.1 unnamed protein product [Rotaria sordida]